MLKNQKRGINMKEAEINEEEKMTVRKILNSDIFERKNGTLMPFYNLKAD